MFLTYNNGDAYFNTSSTPSKTVFLHNSNTTKTTTTRKLRRIKIHARCWGGGVIRSSKILLIHVLLGINSLNYYYLTPLIFNFP